MDEILVVVGSAPNAYNDIIELGKLCLEDQKFHWLAVGMDAVNICHWNIQYFATYHPEDIPIAKKRREVIKKNIDYKVVGHLNRADIDFMVPYERPSGSSALLGALFGIMKGYKKIVVCGCPLEGTNEKRYAYNKFQAGWIKKGDFVKPFTRSMSGWTGSFLGLPTKEWLCSSI